jgi:hypothetical protein
MKKEGYCVGHLKVAWRGGCLALTVFEELVGAKDVTLEAVRGVSIVAEETFGICT